MDKRRYLKFSKGIKTNCNFFEPLRHFLRGYYSKYSLLMRPILNIFSCCKEQSRGKQTFSKVSAVFCAMTLVCLFSCSSYKQVSYFKDLGDNNSMYTQGQNIATAVYHPITIQPDDILQVVISTIDPGTNEAFNVDQEDNSAIKSDVLNAPKRLSGYLVDKKGDIELPVLGRFHVAGETTEAIKDSVQVAALKILKHPVVNVRLANFTVNVLGEVTHPGSYVISGEKASVLDALGLAGDMTIYGKRDNVILMRTENGVQKKVARFNLNNTQMLSSPYFYLRQGDVIYVEPSKSKAASTDMRATKTYAIAGSILSVILIVISRM